MKTKRTNEAALNAYYRQVRRLLPCSRKQKEPLMAQLKNSVAEHLAEHPEADAAQVLAVLGPPEEVAASYVESMGTAELLKKLRVRKTVLSLVAVVMAVILLSWAAVVAIEVKKGHESPAPYIVVETHELPEDYVFPGETENGL